VTRRHGGTETIGHLEPPTATGGADEETVAGGPGRGASAACTRHAATTRAAHPADAPGLSAR